MRLIRTRTAAVVIALALLAWIAPGHEAGAVQRGTPANPTLFEHHQQCNELAVFFYIDPAAASQWVPPAFHLLLDTQGRATGALVLMNCPDYYFLRTPNVGPLEQGKNIAPASVAHLWFTLQGPAEVLPVPNAQATAPTQYFYAVEDLFTDPVARRVAQRAGKNAVLVSDVAVIDQGDAQTGEITFLDGSRITVTAHTPLLPQPRRFGGNLWIWHVGGERMGGDNGVRLDPASGNASNVNTTRVMFLGLVPGLPNTTQAAIHAEPGTHFADYFGAGDVTSCRATFFKPNNIVNNSSRGDLAWTVYPPNPLFPPPAFP